MHETKRISLYKDISVYYAITEERGENDDTDSLFQEDIDETDLYGI